MHHFVESGNGTSLAFPLQYQRQATTPSYEELSHAVIFATTALPCIASTHRYPQKKKFTALLLFKLTEETAFLSAHHISNQPLEYLCGTLTMRDETNQKLGNKFINAQ